MDKETFEKLEARLWNNPDSLSDEELEQLVQICEEKQTDENYVTRLLCA